MGEEAAVQTRRRSSSAAASAHDSTSRCSASRATSAASAVSHSTAAVNRETSAARIAGKRGVSAARLCDIESWRADAAPWRPTKAAALHNAYRNSDLARITDHHRRMGELSLQQSCCTCL